MILRRGLKSQEELSKSKADLWARGFIPNEAAIQEFSLEETYQKLRALENELPSYLGQRELNATHAAREALSTRITNLEHIKARETAKDWLKKYVNLEREVHQMSQVECEQYLRELRSAPQGLLPEEEKTLTMLSSLVEARLDELDLTDIIARLKRLNPKALQSLMQYIQKMLNTNGDKKSKPEHE